MKKILVAMDSMKGCLDSYHASLWVAAGMQDAFPESKVSFRPVSDGGEGMAEMVAFGRKDAEYKNCKVQGPLGTAIEGVWLKCPCLPEDSVDEGENRKRASEMVAYMDFASAGGLTLIQVEERNPLKTTSYGVGEMINAALGEGINNVVLGLGGSATVDGGLGALQALGLRVLDKNGQELLHPITGGMLEDVEDLEFTEVFRNNITKLNLTLLCDVDAPFTGERGAAHVFGPQKGADTAGVELLEKGMEKVRKVILRKTAIDLNQFHGSGAAGGAAGGFMTLAGGRIVPGASTLLDLTGFDKDIEDADLIITGEGSSDIQTLMGKIPFEILQRGKHKNVPVWLVAGRIRDREALADAGFEKIICINSPDIVERSATIGKDPMDPDVASRRLGAIIG